MCIEDLIQKNNWVRVLPSLRIKYINHESPHFLLTVKNSKTQLVSTNFFFCLFCSSHISRYNVYQRQESTSQRTPKNLRKIAVLRTAQEERSKASVGASSPQATSSCSHFFIPSRHRLARLSLVILLAHLLLRGYAEPFN